jgi:hypothetical protein
MRNCELSLATCSCYMAHKNTWIFQCWAQVISVFPMLSGGELAVVYTFVFLYIACFGSRVWRLDRIRK